MNAPIANENYCFAAGEDWIMDLVNPLTSVLIVLTDLGSVL